MIAGKSSLKLERSVKESTRHQMAIVTIQATILLTRFPLCRLYLFPPTMITRPLPRELTSSALTVLPLLPTFPLLTDPSNECVSSKKRTGHADSKLRPTTYSPNWEFSVCAEMRLCVNTCIDDATLRALVSRIDRRVDLGFDRSTELAGMLNWITPPELVSFRTRQ